jgi:hypothetical protein
VIKALYAPKNINNVPGTKPTKANIFLMTFISSSYSTLLPLPRATVITEIFSKMVYTYIERRFNNPRSNAHCYSASNRSENTGVETSSVPPRGTRWVKRVIATSLLRNVSRSYSPVDFEAHYYDTNESERLAVLEMI